MFKLVSAKIASGVGVALLTTILFAHPALAASQSLSKIHPNVSCTPGSYHYVIGGTNTLPYAGYTYSITTQLYSDYCGDAYSEGYASGPPGSPVTTLYTRVEACDATDYGSGSQSFGPGGPNGSNVGPVVGPTNSISGRCATTETSLEPDYGLAIQSRGENI